MLEHLRAQIAQAARPRLWVIGDVMLDRYLIGGVDRVSPEAPVPVLRLSQTLHRVGGAANVAQNLAALGAQVALAGVVGQDEAGDQLLSLLQPAGIGARGVLRRAPSMTTVKVRALAGAQQLLRIDQEDRVHLGAAEIAALLDGLAAELPHPEIVLVSDYGKGVISAALMAQLRARCGGAPIFVDPKGRDYARYAGASLITPNEPEAALAAGVEIQDEASLLAAARRLAAVLPGADILVTRGARGMLMLRSDGQALRSPARPRQVFDVTGAGDTAIAALAWARAHGLDWPDALRVANVAAGIAVSKVGAAPVHAAELLSALGHDEFGVKLISRGELPELRRTLSLLGRRLVFTNGCFDILHVGHLRLLQAARAMGDALLVAVNSDASVRRLKGPSRPLVKEQDRAALLAGLEAVDFVTLFEEDTPLEAILACRPDVLVKGGDYSVATIVGAPEVTGWGGRVEIVPLVEGRSTTRIVERAATPTP
jgi:D-beta-D-heptose 7-phosphate kinase/D-beta-D-heptose 1-phosphate adenosyltransferase